MPLYGQDSAHSERILAQLFIALLPHLAPLKHVSGDFEKSTLKFDPRSGLLAPTQYVQILRPYRKYVESKYKKVLPHSLRQIE